MNKWNHYIVGGSLALLMAFASACSSSDGDELPVPPTPPEEETRPHASLQLQVTPEAASRSLPDGTVGEENKRHVANVKLHFFCHPEEGGAPVYTHSEDVNWASHFVDLPIVTAQISYQLQQYLEPNCRYTVIAEGYEEKNVYQWEDEKKTLITTKQNYVLSELQARLTDGEFARLKENEYFIGTLTQTTDWKGLFAPGTVIELFRRVAGVYAHFRLRGFDGMDVARVGVVLYKNQNRSLPVLRRSQQAPFFLDYIDDPVDGTQKVLDMTPGDDDTYEGSTYILPIPGPDITDATNYTLAVAIYNASGTVITTKRAKLTDQSGNLIFNTSLGTGIIDSESFYRYPIIANHFYKFGNPEKTIEIVYNANNPFEVIVDDAWEGEPDLGI